MSVLRKLRQLLGTEQARIPVTRLAPTDGFHCVVVCRVVKAGRLLDAMNGDRTALEWRWACRDRQCTQAGDGKNWALIVADGHRHATAKHPASEAAA